MSAPLLEMERISKSFGATHALTDVSLEVRAGEVLALIGENGAGKSTLMKILSGAYQPDAGVMRMSGNAYAPSGPHQARQAGVAMIYQELNLAADLSVEDNIMLGQEVHRWGMLDRAAQRPRVAKALDLLGHAGLRPETPVRDLSVAAQQLVEIARALVMEAKVVVFDEPTSSLTRRDVEHLFEVIRKLKSAGIGIVYISHFLEEVREVSDRFTVLRDGQVAGGGMLADTSESQIVALMVGRTVDELFPKVPHTQGDAILSLESLSGRRVPNNVSLNLRRGEILGIAGLIGAGRTELLRTIFALDPVRNGQVRVSNYTPAANPRARIRAGIGLVSEDRKGEGLAQTRSIADNATYSRLEPYTAFGWVNLRRRREAVQDWMVRLRIKARSPEQTVQELSGGNQQKVAIARVLHQDAHILLLDEPTRGIDVGTKAEIYRLMGNLAAEGKAIIFVSSYLPELMAVCDTLGVMGRGRLREIRPVHEWTEESVMACAIREDDTSQWSASPDDPSRSPAAIAKNLASGVLGPLLALICVTVFFAIADAVFSRASFSTLDNFRNVAVQTCVIAIAALGAMVIVISGGIDLSCGTAVALSATVLAYFLRNDYSPALAIAAGIGTGCLAGLLNGVLISTLRIVPFIVTLGTMTIYLGTAKWIADQTVIHPRPNQIPNWVPSLVRPTPDPEWLQVSIGVWGTLLLAGILGCVLRYTVFGRYVFALGSNESTARLCGINVPAVKIAIYTLGGLFVGIAGLFHFARLSSGDPTSGQGVELQIIAAVVIGGGSLSGGRGSALGALAGAAMIRVISSGCSALGMDNWTQDIVLGVILIAAATVDQLRQQLRQRRLGG